MMIPCENILLFSFTGREALVLGEGWNFCKKAICTGHGDVGSCEILKYKK